MPRRALNLTVGLVGLSLALASSGCSVGYLLSIVGTSAVDAAVNNPGKITWTGTKKVNAATGAITAVSNLSSNITDPTVDLMLVDSSSPVTLTRAKVIYDTAQTSGDPNSQGVLAAEDNSDLAFYAQLKQPDRNTKATTVTIPLTGLISDKLLDYTRPGLGTQLFALSLTGMWARVTLSGTNALGAGVSTKVNIPIQVTVTLTQ